MSLFWGYLPGGCPHTHTHTYTNRESLTSPRLRPIPLASRRQISSGIYFSLSRYSENFELPEDAENYYNQGKRRFWVLLTTFTHNFWGIYHRRLPARTGIHTPRRLLFLALRILDFNHKAATHYSAFRNNYRHWNVVSCLCKCVPSIHPYIISPCAPLTKHSLRSQNKETRAKFSR